MEIAGKNFIQPKAFTSKVEWLECNGNSYIDTGIIPDQNTGFSVTVYVSPIDNNWRSILGCRQISSSEDLGYNFQLQCVERPDYSFRNGRFNVGGKSDILTKIVPVWNGLGWHRIEYIVDNSMVGHMTADGLYVGEHISSKTWTTTYTAIVFASANGSNKPGEFANGFKIADVQLYNNQKVIMDLVAVRVNDVGCMYDKVSKQLFENKGTAKFIVGPDIEGNV